MEQREIILRQKLGKHGYKLKGANERFFVKGTYTDKVASQLDDKKQPIYMTLDGKTSSINIRAFWNIHSMPSGARMLYLIP